MRRNAFHLAVSILFFCGLACRVQADIIILNSGQRIEGILLSRDDNQIAIEGSGGTIVLPPDRVREVVDESPAMDLLRRAQFDLRRDDALSAESRMREAVRLGLDVQQARAWCVAHQEILQRRIGQSGRAALRGWAQITRELAELPEPQPGDAPVPDRAMLRRNLDMLDLDAALDRVVELPEREGAYRDFVLVMAGVFAETTQDAVAARLLQSLDLESFHRAADAGFVQDVLLRHLERLLLRHDYGSAMETVARMQIARLPAAQAAHVLALLHYARAAREAAAPGLAMHVLRTYLAPLNPELAADRQLLTLMDARRRLSETGRHDEAIALYQQYGTLVAGANPEAALGALWKEYGDHLLGRSRFMEARAAYRNAREMDPGISEYHILRTRFEERYAPLTEATPVEAFRLGVWAVENGMNAEAAEAFALAVSHPELRERAEQEIERLERELALECLEECMSLLEQGEPRRALDALGNLRSRPGSRALLPEINRLRDLCIEELKRRAKLRPVQAQALFQDAQRRFIAGEHATALRDLRIVVNEYGDTPAAVQASDFLRHAQVQVLLEQVEAGRLPQDADGLSTGTARPGLDSEVLRLLRALQTRVTP